MRVCFHMACYYIVISSTHLSNGHLRNIKGVFRGPLCRNGSKSLEQEKTLTKALEDLRANFYCQLCDKQYYKHQEFDNHINSYDHAHKQRLKELKQREFARNVSSRSRKDVRRQERALLRLHQQADQRREVQCAPGSGPMFKSTTVAVESSCKESCCTDPLEETLPPVGGISKHTPWLHGGKAKKTLRRKIAFSFSFPKKACMKLESSAAVFCESMEEGPSEGAERTRTPLQLSLADELPSAEDKCGGGEEAQHAGCSPHPSETWTPESPEPSPGRADPELCACLLYSEDVAVSPHSPRGPRLLMDLDGAMETAVTVRTTETAAQGPGAEVAWAKQDSLSVSRKGGEEKDLCGNAGLLKTSSDLSPRNDDSFEGPEKEQSSSSDVPSPFPRPLQPFVSVLGRDSRTVFQWPSEMVSFTSTEPHLCFSCNPLHFDFRGSQIRRSHSAQDSKNTEEPPPSEPQKTSTEEAPPCYGNQGLGRKCHPSQGEMESSVRRREHSRCRLSRDRTHIRTRAQDKLRNTDHRRYRSRHKKRHKRQRRRRDREVRDGQQRDGEVRDGQQRDGEVRDKEEQGGEERGEEVQDRQQRDGEVWGGEKHDGEVQLGEERAGEERGLADLSGMQRWMRFHRRDERRGPDSQHRGVTSQQAIEKSEQSTLNQAENKSMPPAAQDEQDSCRQDASGTENDSAGDTDESRHHTVLRNREETVQHPEAEEEGSVSPHLLPAGSQGQVDPSTQTDDNSPCERQAHKRAHADSQGQQCSCRGQCVRPSSEVKSDGEADSTTEDDHQDCGFYCCTRGRKRPKVAPCLMNEHSEAESAVPCVEDRRCKELSAHSCLGEEVALVSHSTEDQASVVANPETQSVTGQTAIDTSCCQTNTAPVPHGPQSQTTRSSEPADIPADAVWSSGSLSRRWWAGAAPVEACRKCAVAVQVGVDIAPVALEKGSSDKPRQPSQQSQQLQREIFHWGALPEDDGLVREGCYPSRGPCYGPPRQAPTVCLERQCLLRPHSHAHTRGHAHTLQQVFATKLTPMVPRLELPVSSPVIHPVHLPSAMPPAAITIHHTLLQHHATFLPPQPPLFPQVLPVARLPLGPDLCPPATTPFVTPSQVSMVAPPGIHPPAVTFLPRPAMFPHILHRQAFAPVLPTHPAVLPLQPLF